jgi:3-oxoacyl-[acyl-carrier protein] reductase
MSSSLKGHVALVTGSSRGLGRGIALSLGKAGAKVVLNYCNDRSSAEDAMAELKAAGIHAMLIRADASDPDQVADMVQLASDKLGTVDVIVPNATPDQPQKPIEEYDADFYRQMYEFFVLGPYHLAKASLPGMKKQGWGRIVNVTSEVFHCSVPNFSAYVAAKGGQIGWSRSMASELASSGVTVNTVAPGWIPTERHAHDPQEALDAYFETIPMGRWGTPKDVGDAVAFFASEGASFLTGQTLCVNGGRTPW